MAGGVQRTARFFARSLPDESLDVLRMEAYAAYMEVGEHGLKWLRADVPDKEEARKWRRAIRRGIFEAQVVKPS